MLAMKRLLEWVEVEEEEALVLLSNGAVRVAACLLLCLA